MIGNGRFTTVALVVGLAYLMAPIAIVVVNSFNASAIGLWPPPGVSLQWYRRLAEQDQFISAAITSLGVALAASAAAVVAGTAAAVAATRFTYPGRRLVEAVITAPLIVPKVALGLGAFILYLRLGLYGGDAGLVGLHMVLVLPFAVSIIAGGLAQTNLQLEHAARDLGAGPVRAFTAATLPQLRGSLIAAFGLCFMISFDEVDATIFVLGPAQTTLPVQMYQFMQRYQDPTLAALSTLLIVVTFVVATVVLAAMGGSRLVDALGSRRRT